MSQSPMVSRPLQSSIPTQAFGVPEDLPIPKASSPEDAEPCGDELISTAPLTSENGAPELLQSSHDEAVGRVLLVDDDEEILFLLKTYLEVIGLECSLATNGVEAIEKAVEVLPDLIVLDLMMPDVDGFETCRQLRSRAMLSTTPIMFLSSEDREDAMLQAFALGADDYITKPFNPKPLSLKIQKAVERNQAKKSPFNPGSVLHDRYEILRKIGAGGMGLVYLVFDRQKGDFLALKTLPFAAPDKPRLRARLLQEIEALQRIEHPDVIAVVECDVESDNPYYMMPYMSGGSLADKIVERGPFRLPTALALTAQISDAVHAAHQCGILHRDLKSENVLFDGGGFFKVTDFSLALPIHMATERLTREGMLAGTPLSMSPDQIHHSKDLDARSDVFLLGLLLFEMLSGKNPYEGLTFVDFVLQLSQSDALDVAAALPEAPPHVQGVLGQALSYDREKRYQSAEELAQACRAVLLSLQS